MLKGLCPIPIGEKIYAYSTMYTYMTYPLVHHVNVNCATLCVNNERTQVASKSPSSFGPENCAQLIVSYSCIDNKTVNLLIHNWMTVTPLLPRDYSD